MEQEAVTGVIIGCAMSVHRELGPGFLESVYQNALIHELRSSGLVVESERPIQVRYRGIVVGEFVCDLLVGDSIIVENKAVQAISRIHEVQLVNYLAATGIDVGILLNFGAQSLEFKRKSRIYRATSLHDFRQDAPDSQGGHG